MDELRKIAKLNMKKDKDKYELISQILQDDDCFKKMNIKVSYSILSDLGFKEDEIKQVYNEIIFGK